MKTRFLLLALCVAALFTACDLIDPDKQEQPDDQTKPSDIEQIVCSISNYEFEEIGKQPGLALDGEVLHRRNNTIHWEFIYTDDTCDTLSKSLFKYDSPDGFEVTGEYPGDYEATRLEMLSYTYTDDKIIAKGNMEYVIDETVYPSVAYPVELEPYSEPITQEYTLDSEGRVTQVSYSEKDMDFNIDASYRITPIVKGEFDVKINYTYNSDGYLIRSDLSVDLNGRPILTSDYIEYLWEDGNLVKMTRYYRGSTKECYTIRYGEELAPALNINIDFLNLNHPFYFMDGWRKTSIMVQHNRCGKMSRNLPIEVGIEGSLHDSETYKKFEYHFDYFNDYKIMSGISVTGDIYHDPFFFYNVDSYPSKYEQYYSDIF